MAAFMRTQFFYDLYFYSKFHSRSTYYTTITQGRVLLKSSERDLIHWRDTWLPWRIHKLASLAPGHKQHMAWRSLPIFLPWFTAITLTGIGMTLSRLNWTRWGSRYTPIVNEFQPEMYINIQEHMYVCFKTLIGVHEMCDIKYLCDHPHPFCSFGC